MMGDTEQPPERQPEPAEDLASRLKWPQAFSAHVSDDLVEQHLDLAREIAFPRPLSTPGAH
jgi:hypothetical protein